MATAAVERTRIDATVKMTDTVQGLTETADDHCENCQKYIEGH